MGDKTIVEKLDEHQYQIPVYTVVEGKGIELTKDLNYLPDNYSHYLYVQFVRGSKVDGENKLDKLDGVLVEQLLEVCRQHLVSVNVGQLASRETSLAITAIEEAMLRLYQREYNRKKANTLGTYQK